VLAQEQGLESVEPQLTSPPAAMRRGVVAFISLIATFALVFTVTPVVSADPGEEEPTMVCIPGDGDEPEACYEIDELDSLCDCEQPAALDDLGNPIPSDLPCLCEDEEIAATGEESGESEESEGSEEPGEPEVTITVPPPPPPINLTFNATGGYVWGVTNLTLNVRNGLSGLPSAARGYYVFQGWYTQPSGGTKVTYAYAAGIKQNTMVYAQWKKARHLSFNANGGKTPVAYRDVTPGAKIGSLPTPTRTNYRFAGWYTKKSGGTKITTSTKAAKTTGTTTYYAHWTPLKTYKFNANGGYVWKTSKSITAGNKLGALPKPTRPGYTFMGWYTSKAHGGSKRTSETRSAKKAGTVYLFARWAPTAMYQTNGAWSSKKYSTGTMSNSGCGPAAASIAVRAISGNYSVSPWTAATWSTNNGYTQSGAGRTKASFFVDYPATYGVKVTPIPGGSSASADAAALAAVKRGDWVIAFMRPGNWAVNGHYILWYDVDGGTALVRDPYSTSTKRTRGKVKLLQQQAWGYYIVTVPDHKKTWKP